MSTRLEWIHTSHPFLSMTVVPPGTDVLTGELSDSEEFGTGDEHALVIGYDEAVVIHGPLGDIRGFLQQALLIVTEAQRREENE